jgi:hypothetical protein
MKRIPPTSAARLPLSAAAEGQAKGKGMIVFHISKM